MGESCGHLQRPGSPCHRGIRTSTELTERLGSLERCPHRQARGRCLFSTSVPFVTTLDSHPTCSLVCVLYTLLARCRASCTHRVPSFLCLVLVCIRWPPPCVLVELSSSQRFLSTGNGARQHIKMGHTLRAASLDLHLSNPSPSLPSNPMLFPSLFPAVIPFPGGIGPVLDGAPHHNQNFCNKAHMSRRCWLIFSCISRPEYVAA